MLRPSGLNIKRSPTLESSENTWRFAHPEVARAVHMVQVLPLALLLVLVQLLVLLLVLLRPFVPLVVLLLLLLLLLLVLLQLFVILLRLPGRSIHVFARPVSLHHHFR